MSWRGRVGSRAAASMLLAASGCGGTQPGDAPPTSAAPANEQPVTTVPPRLRERFPILRSRPEGVPQEVRDVVRTPSLGMSLDLAQRIPVGVAGTYWLVPARGYLCVMHYGSLGIPAAGMNCAPNADAASNGVANIAIGPRGSGGRVRLIVGVAPRGAREAVVRTRGETATAPVARDVFVMRDSLIAPPDSITLR